MALTIHDMTRTLPARLLALGLAAGLCAAAPTLSAEAAGPPGIQTAQAETAPSEPPAQTEPAAATPAVEQAPLKLVPAEPTPAAEAAAPPDAPPGPKWTFIQLASLKSAESAAGEWSRLQKAHPDLLGAMALVVQSAKLEDRGTYFRVQTGPFPNRATAEDMCWQLKEKQQDCVVIQRR